VYGQYVNSKFVYKLTTTFFLKIKLVALTVMIVSRLNIYIVKIKQIVLTRDTIIHDAWNQWQNQDLFLKIGLMSFKNSFFTTYNIQMFE